MSAKPKISLLLSVRNGMPFLPATIRAWLAQTCTDFELLVWDNGSTDETLDIVHGVSDPRIRVVHAGSDHGLQAGWFSLVREARGEFCLSPDADDLPAPGLLQALADLLEAEPAAALAHSGFSLIDSLGNAVSADVQPTFDLPGWLSSIGMLGILTMHNPVKKSAALMRTGLAKAAAARAGHRMLSAVDWYFWFLLFAESGAALFDRRPLLAYRLHSNSLSHARDLAGRREVEDLLAPWCGLLDAAEESAEARELFASRAGLFAPVLLARMLRVALRRRFWHPESGRILPRILRYSLQSPLRALRLQARLRKRSSFPYAGFLAGAGEKANRTTNLH